MVTDSKDHWLLPEVMQEEESRGVGVYGRYNRSAESGDFSVIESDAMTDDSYARSYAANLLAHLRRARVPTSGRIVDVGCAFGHITNAIQSVFGASVVAYDIDLSHASTTIAQKRYPNCHFRAGSADDLSGFADHSIDLIHAREFYPFTRTGDVELHRHFLRGFAPKLKPGAAMVAVQIIDRAGLADTLGTLRQESRALGYATMEQRVVVPYRFYRHAGDMSYSPVLYPLVSLAGMTLERFRPRAVSYMYVFRRA